MKESKFDDIRPYNAEEFPEAMQRIANSSSFPILASFVYPGEPLEEVRQRIANYKNVYEFQSQMFLIKPLRCYLQGRSLFQNSSII